MLPPITTSSCARSETCGIDADGLRDIRERAAGVDRHFVRIFVNHANDEMRGVFLVGLRGGISFDDVRNFVRP